MPIGSQNWNYYIRVQICHKLLILNCQNDQVNAVSGQWLLNKKGHFLAIFYGTQGPIAPKMRSHKLFEHFLQKMPFFGHFLGLFWALLPMFRYFEHPNRVCQIGTDCRKPASHQAQKYMEFWLSYGSYSFAYFKLKKRHDFLGWPPFDAHTTQ